MSIFRAFLAASFISLFPLIAQAQTIELSTFSSGAAKNVSYLSVGVTEDEHAVSLVPGLLYSITVSNANAAVRYLKCENDTVAGTAPGTDTPEFRIAVPANGIPVHISWERGWIFSTALTCWMVTEGTDAGVTEVAANELMVFYTYK